MIDSVECAVCYDVLKEDGVKGRDGPQLLLPNHDCPHVLCRSCWFEISRNKVSNVCPLCNADVVEWLYKAGYFKHCICKDKIEGKCMCIPCKVRSVSEFKHAHTHDSELETLICEQLHRQMWTVYPGYVRKVHINDETCYKCEKKYTHDNCKFIPEKHMNEYGAVRSCSHGHCYECLLTMKDDCQCQQFCELCLNNMSLWLKHCFV